MIDDVSVASDGAVTTTPCLTYSGCVYYLRVDAYNVYALSPRAGVTWVKVRQMLNKLWNPYCVYRKAA